MSTIRRRSYTGFPGVFAATLVVFLAAGVVLAVLPQYVEDDLDAGRASVGLVVGSFALSAIVARPLLGRLADTYGREAVLLAGCATMAFGSALLFLPAGLPGAVSSRLIAGVGQAAVFTAGSAWAVDLAPSERRGRTIAWFGLSVWIGLSVGPALGLALDAAFGRNVVWACAALAPLLSAVIASFTHPSPVARAEWARGTGLIVREALAPGIALGLVNVGYATVVSFAGLMVAAQGDDRGALVFPAFAIAVVGSRLILGGLPDRLGALRTALAGAISASLGLATIGIGRGLVTALCGALVMGSAFSILYPALATWVVGKVDEDRRGAALGTLTGFFDAGVGLGAPAAGIVALAVGYSGSFWMASACAALAAVLVHRLVRASGPDPPASG